MKCLNKLGLVLLAMAASAACFGQTNDLIRQFLNREKSPAYQQAAIKQMLAEANTYVQALDLSETNPFSIGTITSSHVTPPFVASQFGALGSFQTMNFSYGFGRGKHLCYITRIIKSGNPYDFEASKPYAIAPTDVNTNAAYQLATQFLARAFVNVSRLSTSCVVRIEPWVILRMTTSKYTVQWERDGQPIVKVVLSPPKNELWTLRVEDPSLILRLPLEITNLDFLLAQTNGVVGTNAPSRP
jgi:hypothetical protein